MNIGLIFGMIVAIMMMAVILVIGYEQIVSMQEVQQDAQFQRSMKSLENMVDRVYNLGGESSERFTLSVPQNVRRVCFVPLFQMNSVFQNNKWVDVRVFYDNGVKDLLEDLLERFDYDDADEVALLLNSTWEKEKPAVLVFFTMSDAPKWYDVPYLAPSKDGDEIRCANPNDSFWLKRHFDDDGAWVDIEEI